MAAQSSRFYTCVVCGRGALARGRGGTARQGASGTLTPPARLKVLHLAFEDHRKPQSGGGARRTHEINRRLAADFDIEVVTARYPGSSRREEDGVRYRQCGFRGNYYLNVMSYHLCLPWIAARSRADLVIEDFASPISSALVPLWTRRPTLAIVQWLFAGETSRQYRLPFFVLEFLGLRLQHRYVAVSDYIGGELRRRSPGATVDVVPAGVEPDALALPRLGFAERRPEIVFLGRFQLHAKGIDRLVDAFTRVADQLDADLVLIGDGTERARVEKYVAESGSAGRIRIEPWADGATKLDRLARAQLVVVPSSYETFGLVALEALAAGTPVVGFAIPALREVVPASTGRLVPTFDTDALGQAIVDLLSDSDAWERLSVSGREHAATFTWDKAAFTQRNSYFAAASRSRRRRAWWLRRFR